MVGFIGFLLLACIVLPSLHQHGAAGVQAQQSKQCPFGHNSETDLFYTTTVHVKTNKDCSEGDLEEIGTAIDIETQATIADLKDAKESENEICKTPVVRAARVRRQLWGGSGFTYSGGGRCRWCHGDDSDDRRWLLAAPSSAALLAPSSDGGDVDELIAVPVAAPQASPVSSSSTGAVPSPTGSPTPVPTPQPTADELFVQFQNVAKSQMETEIKKLLKTAFGEDSSHCLYKTEPGVAVKIEQTTSFTSGAQGCT